MSEDPWTNTEIPKDEVFEIGQDGGIKGKTFSSQLMNKEFLRWVNDLLLKDYANAHEQLRRFHRFARAHGAYNKPLGEGKAAPL